MLLLPYPDLGKHVAEQNRQDGLHIPPSGMMRLFAAMTIIIMAAVAFDAVDASAPATAGQHQIEAGR